MEDKFKAFSLRWWNRMATKSLVYANQKRGRKYYAIYEYCMKRRVTAKQ